MSPSRWLLFRRQADGTETPVHPTEGDSFRSKVAALLHAEREAGVPLSWSQEGATLPDGSTYIVRQRGTLYRNRLSR